MMHLFRRWWWRDRYWDVRYCFQRAFRGYDERDLFNLGDRAAARLAELLKKVSRGGFPMALLSDKYFSGASPEEQKALDQAAEARWEEILQGMQEGFEAAEHLAWDCNCFDYASPEHREFYQARWDKGMDLAKEWLLAVWN